MWNGAQWECLTGSQCVCVRVCVSNSSGLAEDRCASWDTTIPVFFPASLFYYHLMPSPSHANTSKQVEENNHQSLCALRPDSRQLLAQKMDTATQRAECIFGGKFYFSRHVSVIIIPEVAHVWSQRAVEQHSTHSAPRGTATKRWWGKQVLWLRLC